MMGIVGVTSGWENRAPAEQMFAQPAATLPERRHMLHLSRKLPGPGPRLTRVGISEDARRNVKGDKNKQQNSENPGSRRVAAGAGAHPTLLRTSRWFSAKPHNGFLLQGLENQRDKRASLIFPGTDTCETQVFKTPRLQKRRIKGKICGWSHLMPPPLRVDLEDLQH